ncbi:MAG: hypothetical protein LBP26_00620 [Clostridiales bacterium]|jgi:hypothetical protein|nr:hypothetical protein [Clostridiales bacterium]
MPKAEKKVERVEFLGLKNCFKLSGGGVEAIVTTDVGPRVISYAYNGGPNHMRVFEDDFKIKKSDVFVPFGGHRTWHAPEVGGRTNLPDITPCKYTVKPDGITVMSSNALTGLSQGFDITIGGDGLLTVNHTIANDSLFDVELSVWALSQLALGGVLAVPNSRLDTGFIANRAVAVWPYSKMNDRRVYFGDKYITVKPDALDSPPFKFGSTVDENYSLYFNHGQVLAKRFDYFYGAEYPNYYCNFESYTNAEFIETESLSPLLTVEPGEVAVHTEVWAADECEAIPEHTDENAIQEAAASVLKKLGR